MTEAEKTEFINRFDIMAGNIGNYSNEPAELSRQRQDTERHEKHIVSDTDTLLLTQIEEIHDYMKVTDPFIVLGMEQLGQWTWGDSETYFFKKGLGRISGDISDLFSPRRDYPPFEVALKPIGSLVSLEYNLCYKHPGHKFHHYYQIFMDFLDGRPLSIGQNHLGANSGVVNLEDHPKPYSLDEMIMHFSMYIQNGPKIGKVRNWF